MVYEHKYYFFILKADKLWRTFQKGIDDIRKLFNDIFGH